MVEIVAGRPLLRFAEKLEENLEPKKPFVGYFPVSYWPWSPDSVAAITSRGPVEMPSSLHSKYA